ncbi:MAG: ArsR/SmtB family transcription factor [Hyphomicrobiaceae bacterium]
MTDKIEAIAGLAALKAAAEITRLRILMLLRSSELTVKDLTQILGQSQPRLSRHLKLLHDAGQIERHREGSWVFFRLANAEFTRRIVGGFETSDPLFRRDRERLKALTDERAVTAQSYFQSHAADWDHLRSLYVDETVVEAAMRRELAATSAELLVDLGTGTGRILELFSDLYARGLGIDANQAMLNYARAKLDDGDCRHAQVRKGDIYNLNIDDGSADVVVMHQVLHHLTDPQSAISEASRILRPSGRLLVVDFAPHDLDALREHYAHARLGFGDDQMQQWFAGAQLKILNQEKLAPGKSGEGQQLTVSIWLAERQARLRLAPEMEEANPPREVEDGRSRFSA